MMEWIIDLFTDRNFGAVRSPKWSDVRKAFIRDNPTCAFCGKGNSLLNSLNVHHQTPFSQNPSLELEISNLITLCRRHHLDIGHLSSWKSWNATIKTDCEVWLTKKLNRP